MRETAWAPARRGTGTLIDRPRLRARALAGTRACSDLGRSRGGDRGARAGRAASRPLRAGAGWRACAAHRPRPGAARHARAARGGRGLARRLLRDDGRRRMGGDRHRGGRRAVGAGAGDVGRPCRGLALRRRAVRGLSLPAVADGRGLPAACRGAVAGSAADLARRGVTGPSTPSRIELSPSCLCGELIDHEDHQEARRRRPQGRSRARGCAQEEPMTRADAEEPIGVELPPTLRATRRGAVAHLRLARSEKRNALDDVTVLGLETFFTRLPKDIRAVVLTGEGAHFSAGLDLSDGSPSPTARSARGRAAFAHVASGVRGDPVRPRAGDHRPARRRRRRRAGAGRRDPHPRRRALDLLRPARGPARHLSRRRRLGAHRPADRRRAGAGPDADRPHAERRGRPCGGGHAISGRGRQGAREGDGDRRQGRLQHARRPISPCCTRCRASSRAIRRAAS